MSEQIVAGDFGEAFVSFLLSKNGVKVVRADTKGFDLFTIDNKGDILPKDEMIGISVKARFTKNSGTYSPTIPIEVGPIEEASTTWKIQPWIVIVVGNITLEGNKFECYLCSLKQISNFTAPKRKNAVSVAQLRKDETGIVKRLI